MQKQTNHKTLGYAEILIFVFIWLAIFFSPILIQNDYDNIRWQRVYGTWKQLAPFVVLSIINHFVLVPVFFFRKKKLWFFVSVVVLLVLFSFFLNTIPTKPPSKERRGFRDEQQLLPPERRRPPAIEGERRPPHERRQMDGMAGDRLPPEGRRLPPARPPANLPPYVNSILVAILIIGFDTGLRTIFKWSKSEQEKESLEKEKVKSELAFLRNQVSPHFFMNTLNNIHALIDFDKDEAKESIIRLSKLMRHFLYDSEGERIELKKEVEFIKNYVELMKLRFTDKVKVSLNLPEVLPDQKIPPLLFTSFIENAFKHGVSYNAQSFINVSLSFVEKRLVFEMQNSNFSVAMPGSASGIGLENIRKRLELLYGSGYNLEINDQSDVFGVKLAIPV